MEYKNKPHRLISLGIFLVTAVLLLSVIPFTGNADESHPFYGWVYDQDSRRPIENVKVTLFDPDFEEEIINDMTDINGEFTLDAEPGHYIVHYSHSRYLSTASFEMMNDEDENLGDVFLTKITGVEDANLTGNIRDSKGNPGKDAHVYLIDTNASHDGANIFGLDDSHVIMTRADTDGDYAFDNAYTGNFSLMARVGSSRYYFGNETDVNLTAGANTRDLVYDDYNDGSTVYVKVFNTTSDNKHKLVDVDEIIIYDDVNNTWNSATTNPVGIRVTDGDNYYLIVRAPGYMTHIEKITVDGYTSISVYLDESAATTRVTNITFTDWENVAFSTTETRQFDDSPAYRNNEWGIFQSGIIRYDADRIFGNGDGTLSSAEANAYETFLNTIGPDGDYTWDKFNVDSKGEDDIGYEYSNYAVTLDAGDSRVNSTSTLQFDYTYDLKAAKEIKAYKVEIKVDHENATVDLPDGYEIVDELSLASHDEDDTTIVYVNGTGQGEFECARNVSPTPVIELTDDFIPDDGIYLYRAGEYIEFNASKSHDRGSPYGGIMSYEWTFEGIGTNDTPVAVWKFIEGTYNITLNVTDNAGGFNEANITLIVDSTPPDVNFSVEPDGVNQGPFVEGNTIVYLNITNLTDTNGIHDNVTWDLGDGNVTGITSADDRNITHQYHYLNLSMLTGENEYTYTINLTVRDRAGNENMVSHTVRVNNTRRPTAHFEITNDLVGGDGRYVFNADENITFNATASHGQDMEIINYTWDFGDDTPLAYEEVVNHTYVENEKYNATLTVKDEVGGTTTVNKTIYVDNLEPTVIFEIEGAWLHDGWYYIDQQNNTNTVEDYLFNLTANGTHDNGPIGNLTGLYNFTWNFGAPDKPPSSAGLVDECLSKVATTYLFSDITIDNKNFTLENVTHYYYTITLTIWDRAGNNNSFSRNIIVNDTEVPEAKFDYKDEIDEGGYMIINGTVSTDNIGIVDYSWVIENPDGELDNRTGEVINVTFSKEGDHTVTLNATDFSGNMDSHDAVVRVRRVPKPDILVNEDEIVYSKDKIKEGDTIEILANITNQGDIEAFNVTVHFYFRKDINDDRLLWVPIGNFTFPGPIVPEETRLANANYTVRESGQIVVNASIPVDAHPSGNPQVDEDPINNEGFQDIYVEPDEDEPDWFLWGAVSVVIIIFVVVTVIFFKKPELMGIKPAKKLKKTKSRKKKKT